MNLPSSPHFAFDRPPNSSLINPCSKDDDVCGLSIDQRFRRIQCKKWASEACKEKLINYREHEHYSIICMDEKIRECMAKGRSPYFQSSKAWSMNKCSNLLSELVPSFSKFSFFFLFFFFFFSITSLSHFHKIIIYLTFLFCVLLFWVYDSYLLKNNNNENSLKF